VAVLPWLATRECLPHRTSGPPPNETATEPLPRGGCGTQVEKRGKRRQTGQRLLVERSKDRQDGAGDISAKEVSLLSVSCLIEERLKWLSGAPLCGERTRLHDTEPQHGIAGPRRHARSSGRFSRAKVHREQGTSGRRDASVVDISSARHGTWDEHPCMHGIARTSIVPLHRQGNTRRKNALTKLGQWRSWSSRTITVRFWQVLRRPISCSPALVDQGSRASVIDVCIEYVTFCLLLLPPMPPYANLRQRLPCSSPLPWSRVARNAPCNLQRI